jgi:diguanylate cyclase (GGDEF)-like protein/PAS domain S-box-containing protein
MATQTLAAIMLADIICIAPDSTLLDALSLLLQQAVSALVVSQADRPVGLLTRRDVLRALDQGTGLDHLSVREWMHSPPLTVSQDMDCHSACRLLLETVVNHLVVVDGAGRSVGLVTEAGLLRHLSPAMLIHDSSERRHAGNALCDSEQWLRSLIEYLPVMLDAFDASGTIVAWNKECERVTGYAAGEVIGNPQLMRRLYPDAACLEQKLAEWAQQGNNSRHWEWDLVAKDGSIKTIAGSTISRWFPILGWAAWRVGIDITGQKRAAEQQRQAAIVFENTSEGIIITDGAACIVAVNRAFSEITGYSRAEVIGRKPSLLRSARHDKSFYTKLWRSLQEAGHWQGEIWNRRKSGEVYPQWTTISAVRNADGVVTHYVSVFSDITSKKRSQAWLEYLAHHDPLTGLPNRLLFHDRLRHALQRARRENYQVAVLFIDLDHFKPVNDTYGHPIGDRLLQAVAKQFTRRLRENDTVARLGGDEFGVLIDELVNARDAALVTQKLLDIFKAPFIIEGFELQLDASIGISLYPGDGTKAVTLIQNADVAMYRAKQRGRGQYQFFATELAAGTRQRVLLETGLRSALHNEELVIYYQPLIVFKTGRIAGAEALLRWRHPQLGLISPPDFIPLAEKTGLIKLMGEWVLRYACRQARAWQDSGLHPGRIAVNLSVRQIQREEIVQLVRGVLEETRLAPDCLELELSENFVMQQATQTINVLEDLKALGVRLAIDNFGTGYSSLSYLKRLPVDRLKIDHSFIHDISRNPASEAVARAIIALGKSMQFQVTAKGVETELQAEFLQAQGCDEAQGYLYSHPVPAVAFAELLAGSSGGQPRQRLRHLD